MDIRAQFNTLLQNQRKLAWLIFFSALLVRIVYAVAVLNNRGLEKGYDAGDYIQFAEEMHRQGWMVKDISEIQLHAGPGYPLILYLDTLISEGETYWISIGINVLLSALLCLGIFHLLLDLKIGLSISALAAFWAVFYIHFIRYVPELNKETLVLFLLLSIVRILYKPIRKISTLQILLAGICYAYLIHIDERYFFLSPFLVAFLCIPYSKKAFYSAVLFSATVGILMMPWLYRNYVVFKRPVILTERTTPFTDKLLGYKSPANPFRQDPISPYKRENLPMYEAFRDSLVKGFQVQSKGYRYISLMEEAILKGDTPRTQSYVEAKISEFWELYKPVHFTGSFTANGYRYQRAWNWASNLIYGIQYGFLLILLPFGVYQIAKNSQRFFKLTVLILCLHTLIHVFIAYGLQRYRVPLDFLLIVLSAFSLDFFLINKKINHEVE